MLGKCPTIELYLQPFLYFIWHRVLLCDQCIRKHEITLPLPPKCWHYRFCPTMPGLLPTNFPCIEKIHSVLQPSPPIHPQNFYIFQNESLYPISSYTQSLAITVLLSVSVIFWLLEVLMSMQSYGICLFLTGLFHLAQCLPGSPALKHMSEYNW
jgi:hypothetical protein